MSFNHNFIFLSIWLYNIKNTVQKNQIDYNA